MSNPSILTKFLRAVGLASPPPPPKRADAIRIGVLGAAKVTPMSVINPANELDTVVVACIGARDLTRATEYAKKHGIPKAVGSYDEVIEDPAIDAVYIPLLNGSHCEWTIKALRAGKHVLVEKPMTVNEYEAKLVLEESKQSDRVVMEAYHHMYHPLMHRVKAIIDSGELGTVKEVQASMQFPWIVSRMMEPDESIHFNLAHGGGSLLEAGCYTVNLARFGCASEPVAIEDAHSLGFIKAQVAETNGKAETGIRASLKMANGAVGTIMCNFRGSTLENSLRIIGTKGELYTNNFMVPHYYHYLTVKSEDCPKKRTEKHYGTGFSTYHYQLEAFANAIKNNAPFPTNLEDGVKNMRAIDMILAQAGLPPRGMKPPGKI